MITTSTTDSPPNGPVIPVKPYALAGDVVLDQLRSSRLGLSTQEAEQRQAVFGPNRLPEAAKAGMARIFFRQFLNPLIYILVVAGIASLLVGKFTDAGFIIIVLLLNAIIGTIQEFSAQQSAAALQKIVTRLARVIRSGEAYELNADMLVPGDLVLLESGDKVPADIRLLETHGLEIDESLLSGESLPVLKDAHQVVNIDATMPEQFNMVYGGSIVTRGRARGIVTATGMQTELGRIAEEVLGQSGVKPPLLLRMELFTFRIAWMMGIMVILLGLISFLRGTALTEVMLVGAALAVAAIPEGLPVAMTVALSISMRRMAKRNVIVRRLVAVESLGSCTYIASDKTGTLTVNELTVREFVLPSGQVVELTGIGMSPEGDQDQSGNSTEMTPDIHRLAIAAVLANEGFLGHRNDTWVHHGDAVDVALLVMAHKLNLTQHELIEQYSELARIPYEPANQYAASLHQIDQRPVLFVKGAQEKILSLCNRMMTAEGETQLDLAAQQAYAQRLAEQGYRVISLAMGYPEEVGTVDSIKPDYLGNLIFLGSVGIIDPLREEAAAAITACHAAGIDVAMITGDHPVTAKVIADGLGLTNREEQVVTGRMLHQYQDDSELDQVTRYSHLYARVEPHQKLTIVQSLQRNGHFVAVTGDGVNDAPALRAAHVGVAMGKSGTDIARETADIIITDDNFNSIVAGIEEGRIAYANVRKVIFLLLSTGAGEIVLFLLSILSGLPIPLTAVQLLWLNLVTNGIQDVALAFEPGEGDELQHPPRSPQEPIFNRAMIERVCLSAVVMGVVAWLAFSWLLSLGYSTEQARNSVLLLMVLFENIHVFNSRSETRSVFRLNPLRNPILLIGTILAQLLHIGAMYMPGLNAILEVQPVSLSHWTILFALAISLLVVIEIYKILKQSKRRAKTAVTPRGPR